PPLLTQPASLPEVDPKQSAVILYTSGTTARPKGVTHTHRTLFETVRLLKPDPVGPDDTLLVMTQMMHVSGLSFGLLPALHQGATAVLLQTSHPPAALDFIERFRCTFTVALPAILRVVVEEQARCPRNVSSLRTVLAGGDTVPVALQRRF